MVHDDVVVPRTREEITTGSISGRGRYLAITVSMKGKGGKLLVRGGGLYGERGGKGNQKRTRTLGPSRSPTQEKNYQKSLGDALFLHNIEETRVRVCLDLLKYC